jgi:hypothetical protein
MMVPADILIGSAVNSAALMDKDPSANTVSAVRKS